MFFEKEKKSLIKYIPKFNGYLTFQETKKIIFLPTYYGYFEHCLKIIRCNITETFVKKHQIISICPKNFTMCPCVNILINDIFYIEVLIFEGNVKGFNKLHTYKVTEKIIYSHYIKRNRK